MKIIADDRKQCNFQVFLRELLDEHLLYDISVSC